MERCVCEDLKGLRIEGGGVASGRIQPDEEGVADCLVLDLTHGPSLFGIAAAKEGLVADMFGDLRLIIASACVCCVYVHTCEVCMCVYTCALYVLYAVYMCICVYVYMCICMYTNVEFLRVFQT